MDRSRTEVEGERLTAEAAAIQAKREAAEQASLDEQKNSHAAKLEERKRRAHQQELSAEEAMAILRQWKHAARAASLSDPMTMENPDFENKPNKYRDWSYLQAALQPETAKTGETAWRVVQALTKHSPAADRAAGSLYGLALGDAVGAPFEFLPVDSRLEPPSRDGTTCEPAQSWKLHVNNWLAWLRNPQNVDRRQSHVFFDKLNDQGELDYYGEFNKFQLKRGQFTDDTSMALCLADSLLVTGKTSRKPAYDGGDCRVRYFNWWTTGINNAFRLDPKEGRTSVGLGGNIAQSFSSLAKAVGLHKSGAAVPPEVSSKSQDAGNGSMMRLAPVPIRFAADPVEAMRVAALSSRATHPGPDAEACCCFMAHFVSKAINANAAPETTTLAAFLDAQIDSFLKAVPAIGGTLPESAGMYKVRDVVRCKVRDPETALWNWKSIVLPTHETLIARGDEWNGHPVIPGYFGAYSVDGLCMALWSMHHDVALLERHRAEKAKLDPSAIKPSRPDRFEDVLDRVVNLRGDADTTGAIACQMAGAFYGFNHIIASQVGRALVSQVRTWDPYSEIPLRALMLADDGGLLDNIIGPDDQVAEPKQDASQ